jgi:hypothetical protein
VWCLRLRAGGGWGMGRWRAVARCLGRRVRRRPGLSLDPASHCLFGISAPSPRQGTASYRRGWRGGLLDSDPSVRVRVEDSSFGSCSKPAACWLHSSHLPHAVVFYSLQSNACKYLSGRGKWKGTSVVGESPTGASPNGGVTSKCSSPSGAAAFWKIRAGNLLSCDVKELRASWEAQDL